MRNKNFQETTNVRELFQFGKGYLLKTTAKIFHNGEIVNAFSWWQTRQECWISPLLFNLVLEVPSSAIRKEKEIKAIRIEEKK